MKDAKTLAYINLFAVLGAIPYLCDLDKEAAELIKGKSVSVALPSRTAPKPHCFSEAASAAWPPAWTAAR